MTATELMFSNPKWERFDKWKVFDEGPSIELKNCMVCFHSQIDHKKLPRLITNGQNSIRNPWSPDSSGRLNLYGEDFNYIERPQLSACTNYWIWIDHSPIRLDLQVLHVIIWDDRK